MTARKILASLGPLGRSALALLLVGCGASAGAVSQPGAAAPQPETTPAAEAPLPPPAPPASIPGVDLDTVRAGPFDNGKMWTFEYPPLDYFRETYGFSPDSSWFERARLGTLRLTWPGGGCSASFVSPHGLVMTNHHCAREGVSAVSAPDERLLDDGFVARSPDAERPWDDALAEQLVAIIDVSDEVLATPEETRNATLDEIRQRVEAAFGGEDSDIDVEMIALWNGARYSAYVFKRYEDLRLVFAPELRLGEFGGEPDNFTYPRYTLDVSLLRVYDEEGTPYEAENFFKLSDTGVEEGDAVFVIGNPGTTNRLQTISQLEYRRAVGDKVIYNLYRSRAEALRDYYAEYPQQGDSIAVRNDINTLANFDKFYGNVWEALHDPVLMARRRDTERAFRQAIESDAALSAEYAGLFDRMAEVQRERIALGPDFGAFVALSSPNFTSAILRRAVNAYLYVLQRDRGAPPEALADVKAGVLAVEQQPPALQAHMLTARLTDFVNYIGAESRIVRAVLRGREPAEAAEAIVANSVLGDSAAAAAALEDGSLTMDDPALQLVGAFIRRYADYQSRIFPLLEQEGEIAGRLGRAHFDVYGTRMPPDATFSLRIADGSVESYEYNGTIAPVYTTLYGLYDHHYSYGAGTDWGLPERWLDPPGSLDLSTPLNFIFTADIIGGNSGAPVLNADLEVVGVVFDGNIESNAGDFIYVPTSNRAIAVDIRGIVEIMEEMYSADRIVEELKTGRLPGTRR